MKSTMTAVALAIAFPAAAQTAPAAPPATPPAHEEHGRHRQHPQGCDCCCCADRRDGAAHAPGDAHARQRGDDGHAGHR